MPAIAVLAAVFVYLQVGVMVKNQSAENTSTASYIVLLFVTLAWMGYGILWHRYGIALSAFCATAGCIAALVLTVTYSPDRVEGAFQAYAA